MIKKLFSSQLRLNMASGVATAIINSVAMMIAYPLYLHYLGYEMYGVWLVLATVLTFAQLGNLGIGTAVTKLVAEEYGRGNIEGVQHYVTTALALLCISGVIVLIALLVFRSQIIAAFKLSGDNARTASYLLLYIGMLSIYVFFVQIIDGTLSGLGRMDLANYIQALSRLVSVAAAGVLLYRGLGVAGLLIGSTSSYLFNHLIGFICIRRIANIHFLRFNNLDAQCGKLLLRFGGSVFGGSLISMLFSPFNKLMLSRYAGVAVVPVYEIAFTGSMQVRSLVEAGLRPLMPEISRLNGITAQETKNRIIHIYRRAMNLLFVTGIPMYGLLAAFAPWLLKLWLGDRFVETLPGVFRIMLIGTLLSLLGVPAYYTLMATGHVRHNLGAHVTQAIINIVIIFSILITLTVSINAIVWSSSIAMAGATLYLIVQKYRILHQVNGRTFESETNKDNAETVPK